MAEEQAPAGPSAGERGTFRKLLIRVQSNLDPRSKRSGEPLQAAYFGDDASMAFGDRSLKIAGIRGPLQEGSVSFGGLIVESAEKPRSEAPIGALA
ncbi:MAG TPA: hypothetical protein VFQ09_01705 [Rubrobacter sp.]|nr:hypothetical protein [Rubrobacter sp.]